jgi:ABC-2 type transport system permease protein/lipopolysaccharide transport system permease protein
MVRSVAERELRARYKQTYLGYAWAVITPFAFMLAFVLFFNKVASVDHGDAPYALYTFLGLIPWTFFSTAMTLGGNSLISATPLLNKVYCPREVFALGSVSVAFVDALISIGALVVLFIAYTFMPHPESVWLPYLWLVQVVWTIGLVFLLSSIVVYFRDLRAIVPLALQLGLFVTPIAYSLDSVPESIRPFYIVLNPGAVVIDASRRTVLYGMNPVWSELALASASAATFLLLGYLVFKKLETGIADVV